MRGKHKGHRHPYTDQRDLELYRAFCKAKEEQMQYFGKISLTEAIEMARTTPTTRYFVSEQRASLVIKQMLKGDMELTGMSYMKVRMFRHLYFQYKKAAEENPDFDHEDLVVIACSQPANEFYITHKSAIDILSHIHRNHIKAGVLSSNQSLIKERRKHR